VDETTRMLDLLNSGFPDLAALPPLAARAAADARVRIPGNLDDVARTDDIVAPTADGDLALRVYRPLSPHPLPTTVYAHGGGLLHGSIASHDGFCRRWARGTGSVVVSVEYRLAPEHLHPSGVADIVAAARWAAASGLAPEGVLLAGDSAGATLAALAALALRAGGGSPAVGQILLYPMLDPRMASASYRTRGRGYFVTARQLRFYWETALGTDAEEIPADPALSPWFAADLADLPPAVIVTAGLDPLCDEGREYGRRLMAAGVPTVHRRYPDQFHGFVTIPDYGPAEAARDVLWSDIRSAFTKEHSA